MAKKSKSASPAPRHVSVFDDPPRKNVFLLSCMDQRLLDDTVRFMNALNLQNRYDQLALAGGAMGAHRLPGDNLPPPEQWKTVFFIHLREAINTLHRPIKDVFLFEHLDCGAYKYLHPHKSTKEAYGKADLDGMRRIHLDELREFAKVVRDFIDEQHAAAQAEYEAARKECDSCKKEPGSKELECWKIVKEMAKEKAEAWSEIRVSYFVMNLLGWVQQLDVPEGEHASLPCTLTHEFTT
jgi:hypothetical protein